MSNISDIAFDFEKPFCKLYKGGRHFKENLLRATQTQYIRQDTPSWADDLQFLTVGRSQDIPQDPGNRTCHLLSCNARDHFNPQRFLPDALKNDNFAARHSGSAGSCRCASSQGFDSRAWLPREQSGRKTLRLTSPGELTGCTHYLAVSYRWPQDLAAECYDIVLPTGERRDSNVPAWLLDRVLAYAASQGFKLIWIDQECIDQNDKKEVERSVDANDVVYRQSQQVVAVLTCAIAEQAHLDAFRAAEKYYIEREEMGTITAVESELRSIMQVSALISTDPWFTRIWTLQESLVADGPLHFLVPCGYSLRLSHWLGDLSDQIVVHQLVLQKLFCPIIKPYAYFPRRVPLLEEEIIQRLLKSEPGAIAAYHRLQESCPEFKWRLRPCRPCTAVEACRLLSERGAKNHADRIVIMANICGYKKRLSPSKLIRRKLGFSISTLALSIINGDYSLLGYIQREPYEQRSEAFSWLPLPVGSLKIACDFNCAMNNAFFFWANPVNTFPYGSVTREGLLTSGYLFPMTCHIKVDQIKANIDEYLHMLRLDSASEGEGVRKYICEIFEHIYKLAGPERAGHLVNVCLWDVAQPAANCQDFREVVAPLRFLKNWNTWNDDQKTLHFSDLVNSCCLFTDLDDSVTDYVFVPDSNFLWNDSHYTVGLAWNVQLVHRRSTRSNPPLQLRYLGQPDEELCLLGLPKHVQAMTRQQFLIR